MMLRTSSPYSLAKSWLYVPIIRCFHGIAALVRGEERLRELRLAVLRRHRQDQAQAFPGEHALERLGDQLVVLRHVVARVLRIIG
jgi:hypothetical protein